MRRAAFSFCHVFVVLVPAAALAQPARSSGGEAPRPDADIEIAPEPPEPEARENASRARILGEEGATESNLGEMLPPTPRPRRHGLVLESTLGVLAFAGQFRHVAPPAFHMRALLGYEIFSWLMMFGEGELAFTDTSESEDASQSRAFDMWGFDGGLRAGLRLGDFGGYIQGEVGALTAQVPHDALAYLGFRGAESLGMTVGGRAGVEWYQRDRHFALCVEGGPRVAEGFSRFASAADLPLAWDAGAGFRYTF